jgi:hypothetical protein
LQIILGGAITTTQAAWTVNYRNVAPSGVETVGQACELTNSTTAVTMLAAPAAGTRIIINSMSVYNTDTASITVTIRINHDGTMMNIIKVTLLTLENLFYEAGSGWQVLTSTGAAK